MKSSQLSRTRLFRVTSLSVAVAAAFAAPAYGQSTEKGAGAAFDTVKVTTGNTQPGYASDASVGGKELLKPQEIAASVTVITEQRIKDQNLRTLADALNQATGVTVISNDTTQSQYRSRGYALGLSHDGIPVYNALSGKSQLDLSIYERVEVLRGPAGIFSGSGDPGGVVNLVRKRAKDEVALSGALSFGSWNTTQGDVDLTGPLNESGTVRGRAVVSLTDRQYFYERTATSKWVGYATLDWDLSPSTTLSLAVTAQEDRTRAPYIGLPAWTTGQLTQASRTTNPQPNWSRADWTTQDYLLELEQRFDSGWVARVKLNRREQSQYWKDAFAWSGVNPQTNTLNYRRWIGDYAYDRDAVDVYASGPFALFGRTHRALVGYNYETLKAPGQGYGLGMQRDLVPGVPFGQPGGIPEVTAAYNSGSLSETRQHGVYGQLRLKPADPLTVVLGGRLSTFNDRSRSVAPSTPTDWSQGARASQHFTPSAAVLYDIVPALTLYSSYSSIFIPQTQLRSDGGTIDPREGRQYEVGAKATLLDGRLNASASVFDLRDRNRAFLKDDGFYLNAGEVQSKGWELEVAGRPAAGYEIQAGYARLDSKYLKDKNNEGLPFNTWDPRNSLKLWGLRRFTEGPAEGLDAGLGVIAVSGSQSGTGSAAVRRQGGYAVLNALLAYRVNKTFSVQLNANNLLDRTYYTRLGGLNTYNSYGEPRSFALTLRAQY